MAELFIELLGEEIPARMQARAAQDLTRLIETGLDEAGLAHGPVRAFVTPRRLALVVDGLPTAQPDTREERRGPRADAPAKAIEGFLGSVGLTLDQVERRDTPKGPVLFAVIERPGQPTRALLPDLLIKALTTFPWPKSMRWGQGRLTWVRPLHGIVALFDGQVLDGGLDLGDRVLPFTDTTRGHRFLAPEPFAVTGFSDYATRLRAAGVMLDAAERREAIAQGMAALAAGEALRVREDPGLLDEVAGLVEWPVPLMGHIDKAFMTLPPEVLITSLREHQKYFCLENPDGTLSARFLVIANGTRPDSAERVVAGNERVLRARLSDARFFWDQDRETPLAQRVDALERRIFHARLGTDRERVERLRALAGTLATHIPGADPALVDRAALLAKTDLVTGMVGEFPELQGLMGAYYARHDGEPEAVADAIRTHYAPQGPSDACPTAPVAVCVALADKLDTLAGFWLIDEKPTGSKDPFALRRAALGVIRLIVENGLRLPLGAVIAAAAQGYRTRLPELDADITADLLAFFADRLKVRAREQGVRHDLIAAVLALGGEDDLVRLLARVEALTGFLDSTEGADLLAAYRRAMNIVRIEAKRDRAPATGPEAPPPDPALFETDEERALAGALDQLRAKVAPLLAAEAFTDTMAALACLRAPVDAFFDRVTVNADNPDLRTNRLRLLGRIGAAMGTVADFSRIEG
ncbi:glycine--tRNA ligase subunit beta [Pararhodospirillum oryzae]|uniref:Glycine--tRNA ligase beta subunit n=1 Tax=Pararhodospirillum oryzae TaxID=478448 RepID=A0A512HAB7_9PROT|nr:glycine--tRNA ligase subunit beta [Pararhodospirillum oryzae]GEO82396.1 glycine--tRNA ligase beta subunit [Pararhodospirillum oryzae]